MKAIFLDRDGTLNDLVYRPEFQEHGPPWHASEVALLPGVSAGLQSLQAAGFMLFVVTNQPDAAKGKATPEQLVQVKKRFCALLAEKEIIIDAYQACYHHPYGLTGHKLTRECACRKPGIGMLKQCLQAYQNQVQEEVELNRHASFFVGDRQSDRDCAKNFGIPFIGLQTCSSNFHPPLLTPHLAQDFTEACGKIIGNALTL